MITYKGKYNTANVMTDNPDETTVSQIYSFLNHPAFSGIYIAIMPDCHAGKGSVIGFTSTRNDYVIPNVVGVDINCAVVAYNFGKIDVDRQLFDDFIRATIPAGHRLHSNRKMTDMARSYINSYGNIYFDEVLDLGKKIGQKPEATIGSIGTLGGGNHFIELGRDPEGNLWALIHSGSRDFGKRVCEYHQDKAKQLMKQMFVGSAYQDAEFLPLDNGGFEYLRDMHVAQGYADINRLMMMSCICEFFGVKYDSDQEIRSSHNYISYKDKIIRKGAVSAQLGEKVVIPFNSLTGTAICTGKGSKKWNYSAPHGAGRLMSRTEAKRELNLDRYQTKLAEADVFTTTATAKTLDESFDAYKDAGEIMEYIQETVDIDFMIKPIYNFKSEE